MKSGSLNLLEPSGPHPGPYGTPLPLLPVLPRPAPEPTPSVQWVPGSVSEAVAEIEAEQLPVSSATCQCVMNHSTSLPPYLFVILHLIRHWDVTWLLFLHVGLLICTFLLA
jgi:hypothetical protein